MSYPEGHVERFGTARSIINSASQSATTDQTALKLGGKVGMTLEAYEAIAETIQNRTTEIVLTVPARHLTTGDHFNGMTVSQIEFVPGIDGETTHHVKFTLVVPYTTHTMLITVWEKDLDAVSFPLTKRGDDYSPNARNAALGLPPVPPREYVAPEPIAVYKAGTLVGDVKHFDRSMKIFFHCPEHNRHYMSKDPFSSHWFLARQEDDWCPQGCPTPLSKMVLTHDYLPTRNG